MRQKIVITIFATASISLFAAEKPWRYDPKTGITTFKDMAAVQAYELEVAHQARHAGENSVARSMYEKLASQKDNPQVAQAAQRNLQEMEKTAENVLTTRIIGAFKRLF